MGNDFGGLIVGILLGLVAGFGIGHWWSECTWKADVVKHGYAEYNQTNGNWQWKSGGGK